MGTLSAREYIYNITHINSKIKAVTNNEPNQAIFIIYSLFKKKKNIYFCFPISIATLPFDIDNKNPLCCKIVLFLK